MLYCRDNTTSSHKDIHPMSYADIARRLDGGGIVVLDGGTGTELERRGVPMNSDAWCGAASLDHLDMLEAIHRDYIAAGAQVITANTFASSRLMLDAAGIGGQFAEINQAAVGAAHRARQTSGRDNVLVAGSLSHMVPIAAGADSYDPARLPGPAEMTDAFGELAALHKTQGCDLILLEMMYHPDRMAPAFAAAKATGLPVWAGFSARRGADGAVLSSAQGLDIPFGEIIKILADFEVAAAGVMHSSADVTGDALALLRESFDGPLSAYPDSGYFKMPEWQFEDVIAPAELRRFAGEWVAGGAQIIGGCCGLSPEHIAAIAPLAGPG